MGPTIRIKKLVETNIKQIAIQKFQTKKEKMQE